MIRTLESTLTDLVIDDREAWLVNARTGEIFFQSTIKKLYGYEHMGTAMAVEDVLWYADGLVVFTILF